MLPVTVAEQPYVLSKMHVCACVCVCVMCVLSRFSHVQPFVTLLTVALYPWDFPGKNPGGRLPFPPPGTDPRSLASPALAGWFLITSATWKALCLRYKGCNYFIYSNQGLQYNMCHLPRETINFLCAGVIFSSRSYYYSLHKVKTW